VCVALGNRGQARHAPALTRALQLDGDTLVRGHAAWALGRLAERLPAGAAERELARQALIAAAATDADAWVREEATLAEAALAAALSARRAGDL
jgi:hypothetical protein